MPCEPLEIIILGPGRPTTMFFHLQFLVQSGIEKLWKKFKISFAKITQWNCLLPGAEADWEGTAATTGGICFLKLLKVDTNTVVYV